MRTINMIFALLCLSTALQAETVINWTSPDLIEVRNINYKYHNLGPKYTDRKHGANYGDKRIKRTGGMSKVHDRVLKRGSSLSGTVQGAPAGVDAGKVWLEDNYGRVLDSAVVSAPDYAFDLSSKKAMHTGIYLKASLSASGKEVWTGKRDIRLTPPDEDPWREFILGVYNMGKKPGTGALWRELGLSHNAVQVNNSPAFPLQNDLKYHSSNILYTVLGLYHRDHKRWKEMKARRKDPKRRGDCYEERYVCLSDPEIMEFAETILTATAQRFKHYPPLHYSIGDEIGIGNMGSPHDMCASKESMAAFRVWLKERYKTIEGLNKQWDADYKNFSDVKMMSNFQAFKRKPSGNFSPWADRLEFMDYVMFTYIKKCADIIRKEDPDAVCNISGWQPPSAWGFDNYWLSQVVNCVTPYELGESPEIMAAFYEDGKKGKIYTPGFGKDMEKIWIPFLRGHAVCAQWDSFGNKPYSKLIDIEKKGLTPYGQNLKKFADWSNNGAGRLRNRSDRTRDKVAILHSQPAIRGNWILEMTDRPDVHNNGEKWVHRDSWSVYQREMMFRLRLSWIMWTKDVGVWPDFVDARQLKDDILKQKDIKVLIVPRVVAMSDETAGYIRAFAEAGGTVIADTWTGMMDDRCKMREKGVLDDMFGISRAKMRSVDVQKLESGQTGIEINGVKYPFIPLENTLKAAGATAGATYKGADVFLTKDVGKGKAIYLNFKLESYFTDRLEAGRVATAKTFLYNLFKEAGVTPDFTVSKPGDSRPFHVAGHDVCLYKNGAGYLVGVRPNPTVLNSGVGGVWKRFEDDKNIFVNKQPAQLNAPAGLYAYDITEHKSLGQLQAVPFTSDPDAGRFYAFWPFSITGIKATVNNDNGMVKLTGSLQVSGAKIRDEKLVVNLTVLRPDGTEQNAYRRNIDVNKGRFEHVIPFGLNEKGDFTLRIHEPCSGLTKDLRVKIP